MGPGLVRRAQDVTPEWLTQALRASGAAGERAVVEHVQSEAIGTGQMSESHRLALDWNGSADGLPATVVLKIASSDELSRATGINLGIYEREVLFYRDVAPRIGGPLAPCHLALHEPQEGWFTLLLEDARPATQGDQIAGCSIEDARLAMRDLARLHGPLWDDEQLASSDWLNQPSKVDQVLVEHLLGGFFERYDARLAPEHRALIERFVPRLDAWIADRRSPFSIVHGDYRLDNMLFGLPGSPRPLTVVDWQTVSFGPPLLDVSYFLGAGPAASERGAHEEELVRLYHQQLVELGVEGLGWDDCWEEYRRRTFHGLLMAVIAPMLVVRTERGDDMFMTSLDRTARQILDLGAEELLPA